MKNKGKLIFLYIIRGIHWSCILSIIFGFLVDIYLMIRIPDYATPLTPIEFLWKMSFILFIYWLSTLITKEIKEIKREIKKTKKRGK